MRGKLGLLFPLGPAAEPNRGELWELGELGELGGLGGLGGLGKGRDRLIRHDYRWLSRLNL